MSSLLSKSLKEWQEKANNVEVADHIHNNDQDDQEDKYIDSFQQELKKVLMSILQNDIKPKYRSEKQYDLTEPLPLFAGGIYIARVARLQEIYISILNSRTLLSALGKINRIRLKLVEAEYSPSTWCQDGYLIQQRLLTLLDITVQKYPYDQRLQYWWKQQRLND